MNRDRIRERTVADVTPRKPATHWLTGNEQTILSGEINGVGDQPVTADDFLLEEHQIIFNRVRRLKRRGMVAVEQALDRHGELKRIGGKAKLTLIASLPHDAETIAYALDEVLDASRQRQAAKIGQQLHKGEIGPVEALEALSKLDHGRDGVADLTIRSPGEILAMPRDKKSCLLGDRLFTKGGSLVIAGIGGLGKSRLLSQLFVAFIIGRDWCGLETHARDATCLIFQTENSTYRLQDDLNALKKWVGKDWPLVEKNLRIHTLETDSDSLLYLSDPNNHRRLERIIRTLNPAIVGFDPLRDFGIGDLNTDADMGETLRVIGRISRVGNPERAIAVVHHAITGRAGAARAFGLERTGFARNSKVLFGWTRAQINVSPGSEDTNDKLVLTCGKNNDGKEFPPIAVRLTNEMIYEVDEGFDIDSWREEINKPSKSRRTFRSEIITEIPWPQPELDKKSLAKLIMDDTGCGRSRAYTLIDEADEILRFNETTRTYAKT